MKTFLITTTLSLFGLFPILALAEEAYVIDSFTSDIDITKEGVVEVQETLIVQFNEERHGIFRELPYRYQTEGGTIYTKIEVISVLQDGAPAEFQVDHNSNNLSVRIGDPDVYVNGAHVYVLTYAVDGVLRNVGQEDELYWNVTGNSWDTTIGTAVATIELPSSVAIRNIACYRGELGSQESCEASSRENRASFRTEDLSAGEGLTVVASWSAGQIPINTPRDPRELFRILLIVVPLVILGGSSYGFYRRWKKTGKDPEIPKSIVTAFNAPEGITPLHAGIILDNRADTVDVSAAIVELARLGHLTIEEVEGKFLGIGHDYILRRTDKSDESVSISERLLLGGLFESGREVKLSSLKNSFYTTLNAVKTQAKIEVHKQGYYTRSLGKQVGLFLATPLIVIISIFLGAVAASLTQESLTVPLIALSILAFAIPAGVWAHYAPQLTERGAETKYQLLGYKQFIETAEKYRAKFYEDQNIIFEVMPYAIMFGLAEKFAKKIEEMNVPVSAPAWYVAPHTLSIGDFSRNMSSFSSVMGSTMSSAPSSSGSSGGGFSGGGFGGGGGGSW